MISVALCAIALAAGDNRARPAEIEVAGPVRDLVFDLGSSGETRLSGSLLAGESVRRSVPLPARGADARLEPRVRWSSNEPLELDDAARRRAGTARFVAWGDDRAAADLALLPPGLRARTRPPVAPEERRVPPAALILLPACFVAGLAARRRKLASLAVAAAGCGFVAALAWPDAARAARGVVVLEGDVGSPSCLRVAATHERAEIPADVLASTVLETQDADARLVLTGSLADESAAWRARAPGATLYCLRAFDPSGRTFAREANGAWPLAEAWLRDEGEWTYRGAWPLGVALPPQQSGAPPPGWLAAGLPQGVPVLLGRTEGGEEGERAWVRWTGL